MSDITIEDLKADMESQTDTGGGEESGGEWINELIDTLDSRGYLDPLIQHSLGMEDMNPSTGAAPAEPAETDGGSVALDAADVAQFGKMVIDSVGDVPMSKVVEFSESNPEQVNQLIEQATQGQE